MIDKEQVKHSINFRSFYEKEIPNFKGNGKNEICPFHNDKNPSLSIKYETGLFNCFGCGMKGDIFDFYMKKYNCNFTTAVETLSQFAGIAEQSKKTAIIAQYDYTDEQGNLLFQAVRCEPKRFFQRCPDGNGGWVNSLNGTILVPYKLPDIIKSDVIFIVEGEKDVESINKLGLTATCNPMGAGKWRSEYNQYFKDKKVVIFPDNDDVGKAHAVTVANNLKDIANEIKLVELPNLPEKGDITDWLTEKINSGISPEDIKSELIALVRKAPRWSFIPEPTKSGADVYSIMQTGADIMKMDIPIRWAVERLIPCESIVLLAGCGGIGKSTICIQLANAVSRGIAFLGLATSKMPVAYIDFENSRAVLKDRISISEADEVYFWDSKCTIEPPKIDSSKWELYKQLNSSLTVNGKILGFEWLKGL